MKKPSNVLELKSVSRQFGQGKNQLTALKKTDFTIKPGQFVAVVGPSGSGKSTFLTIAGGLQNPSRGTVKIMGTDITKLSVKQLSKIRLSQVGFILQSANLVPYLTVEKQLKLIDRVGKRKPSAEQIDQVLAALDIVKLRHKYPSDLSGGERQRVAIAKVLYGDSSLILADEPTASLDTNRAYEVVKILAEQTHQHNKATIMVTHDERMLEHCDAVYEMHDGALIRRKQSEQ